MPRIAYFDCFCGAAGDMILGALVDAGLEIATLAAIPARLGLEGVEVQAERVRRGALSATKLWVRLPGHEHDPGALTADLHHGRTLPQILQILERADISQSARGTAGRVFERLAEAEAAVHGTSLKEVHFHEVGADDALVDIVGTAVGLEELGIDEVVVSPFLLGTGEVQTAHGVLPVPCPATAKLLEGYPVRQISVASELVTPTGAAILTTIAGRCGKLGEMTVESVGYGAGSRVFEARANVLRVFIGCSADEASAGEQAEQVWSLTTQIDDVSPEQIGYLQDRLLQAGALDATVASLLMKKGRPGVEVRVLCALSDRDRFEQILFSESGTLGIRRQLIERVVLQRHHVSVTTTYGELRIKVGSLRGEQLSAAVEYEDCSRLAKEHGVPWREVQQAAIVAFRKR